MQQDLHLVHNQPRQYQNQTSVKIHYGNQYNRLTHQLSLYLHYPKWLEREIERHLPVLSSFGINARPRQSEVNHRISSH